MGGKGASKVWSGDRAAATRAVAVCQNGEGPGVVADDSAAQEPSETLAAMSSTGTPSSNPAPVSGSRHSAAPPLDGTARGGDHVIGRDSERSRPFARAGDHVLQRRGQPDDGVDEQIPVICTTVLPNADVFWKPGMLWTYFVNRTITKRWVL